MSKRYTKAELEEIVYKQLENLNAMHDLLSILKFQNDLIQNINRTSIEHQSNIKRRNRSIQRRSGDVPEKASKQKLKICGLD